MSETVPVRFVEYTDDANLEVNNDGDEATVENHDELVNAGKTKDVIRAVDRETFEEYMHEDMRVRPESPLWSERVEDLEKGDEVVLIE